MFGFWQLRQGKTLKKLSFGKNKRLVSNEQFKTVLARRSSVSDGFLRLFIAENSCGHLRLGVSIGKSCGKAVARNHLKRLLREAFRQNQHKIPADLDYLITICPGWVKKINNSGNAKKTIKQLKLEQVEAALLKLIDMAVSKTR